MLVVLSVVALLIGTSAEVGPAAASSPGAPSPGGETPTAAAPATSSTEAPPAPVRHGPLSLDSSQATGDWGGERTKLEEHGIKISGFLTDYYMGIFKGGLETKRAYRNYASLDILAAFDFGKLGLWDDGEALLHLQDYWGLGVNPWSGALRQVSDDGDDEGFVIAQLWYRHYFLDRKVHLQAGFLDYQTIIDRNAYANSEDRQFQNLGLDNNPLIPLGPGLGVALTVQPVDWYTFMLGTLDAQTYPILYKPGFSTAFHDEAWFIGYLEHGFAVKLPGPRGELPGNYRFGMLFDPRPRAEYASGELEGDDYGFWSSCDQLVYREVEGKDQGLGLFARLGLLHGDHNRFSEFYSGGMQYKGLVPGRDDDVLGVGCTVHNTSRQYSRFVSDAPGTETVYEAYYAIPVLKWLVISPDLQYIDNPGANGQLGHTIVGGLRVRINF
ncbi:MAG TPA: carbohydrate porin [Phycisphaerae bacterium]|nr:carbohydrate porin [Phycisphaerae bacterium]HNU44875.1 carbohydrate porin [Phycisphaerae bacterium]